MDLTMDSTSELEKPLSRIKSFDTIFKESTEFSNLVESHLDKPDFSPAPILLPTDLPDQNKSDVQTLTSSTEHPQFIETIESKSMEYFTTEIIRQRTDERRQQ